MTVQKIIDTVDEICDNRYQDSQKRCWISEVDAKITREILASYSRSVEPFFPYTANTESVIAPEVNLEMYANYVCYKMNLYNNEAVRANNHMAMFNTLYSEYMRDYIRTHRGIV